MFSTRTLSAWSPVPRFKPARCKRSITRSSNCTRLYVPLSVSAYTPALDIVVFD